MADLKASLISSFSKILRDNGIQKGQKVCLLLENTPLWALSFFGTLNAGAACVPLNPELEAQEIVDLLKHSQSSIIVSSTHFQKKVEQLNSGLNIPLKIFGHDYMEELRKTTVSTEAPVSCKLDDLACLVYTSGTTSIPKGVMLTHRNLLANYESLVALNLLKSSDCLICLLPFYHVFPLMVNLILP